MSTLSVADLLDARDSFEQVSGSAQALGSRLLRHEPITRLNAICPYYTMFPLEFPWRVLGDVKDDDWVLDPFCGRGTTLFAARLRRLASVGVDVNPVAVTLARAKLVKVGPDWVIRRCRELLHGGYEPKEVPSGEFWQQCFHEQTLLDVCRLREQLLTLPDTPVVVILRALLLGVLHGPVRKGAPSYLSNQMPRTYATKPAAAIRYWTAQDLKPPHVDVLDVVRRRARYSLIDTPPAASGRVHVGEAASVVTSLSQRFRWVITSPPYYGMRTYLPDQWLRAWFLGGPPSVEYSVKGQLEQHSEEAFVEGLAKVWQAVGSRCVPGARLVLRFGALPSQAKNPTKLLIRSLVAARAGWEIDAVVPAGTPPRGTRQADQFGADAGEYVEEVDLYATLVP